ncbi:MAG: hypothetical protein HKO53_01685 [Gemmatimonadetes bacterium]|nr:hypothetical protein [Gemmatimonadota bacterium]
MRRLTLLSLLGLVLAAPGCTLLTFVEDRLDPPSPTERGIRFQFKAPAARNVNVGGEFNNWLGTANGGRFDPSLDSMTDVDRDGIWEITLPLPPGRYQYKFVIDQVDWQEDPANPETIDDNFGGFNSVLVVPSSVPYEYDEGYLSRLLDTSSRSQRQVTHTFTLEGHADARDVFVSGDFAEWDPTRHPMQLGGDGVWSATVELDEGEHFYKFIVDGNWIPDPGNENGVDDGYGGINSVVTVTR